MARQEREPDDRGRHDAAFASSQADRDVTLQAMLRLESAAGTAAPGREPDWLERVLTDLRLGWLLRTIYNRRARETDLVYEAIHLDLGRSE